MKVQTIFDMNIKRIGFSKSQQNAKKKIGLFTCTIVENILTDLNAL